MQERNSCPPFCLLLSEKCFPVIKIYCFAADKNFAFGKSGYFIGNIFHGKIRPDEGKLFARKHYAKRKHFSSAVQDIRRIFGAISTVRVPALPVFSTFISPEKRAATSFFTASTAGLQMLFHNPPSRYRKTSFPARMPKEFLFRRGKTH